MRFKTGALGICVIIIAISATLLGSWVMSMDVNENEVTKYKSLTDITGLFESEQTPTFTDYSPSTNYTGYYTEDSTVGETRYFDGVDYTASANPNNYRLNLAPTSSDSGSLTFTDAEGTDEIDRLIYWAYNSSQRSLIVESTTLTKLVQTESWGDYDEIVMTATEGSWEDGQFTLFAPKATVTDGYAYLKNPELTGTLYYRDGPYNAIKAQYDAARITNPMMALKYTSWNNQVSLYYDVEMTQLAVQISPDNTLIIWDTISPGFLADGFTYEVSDLPPATYMDPSKGVELE